MVYFSLMFEKHYKWMFMYMYTDRLNYSRMYGYVNQLFSFARRLTFLLKPMNLTNVWYNYLSQFLIFFFVHITFMYFENLVAWKKNLIIQKTFCMGNQNRYMKSAGKLSLHVLVNQFLLTKSYNFYSTSSSMHTYWYINN